MQNKVTCPDAFWTLWGLYQLTYFLSVIVKGFWRALASSGNVPSTPPLFCGVYTSALQFCEL